MNALGLNKKSDLHEQLKKHPDSRTLVCIACGGLNDSLASIGKCFDLCFVDHKYQTLIICDAYSDGLMGQFKQVFEIKSETRRDSSLAIKRIAKIRPRVSCEGIQVHDIFELQNKLDSSRKYPLERTNFPCTADIKDLSNWMLENSIKLDSPARLNKEFDLFIGYGGGPPSRTFLRALRLKEHYGLIVSQFLQKLPNKYDSVHIRNTDMRTDYKTFFHTLIEKIKPQKQLVICSDDSTIQLEASAFFGKEQVCNKNQLINQFLPFSVNYKPAPNQKLHDPDLYINSSDKEIFVVRAIADLFCLAGGDGLFFGKVIQSYSSKGKGRATSGYSLLAEILKKDSSLLCRDEYIS